MRTKLGVVSVVPPGVLWSHLAQPASTVPGLWALQPWMEVDCGPCSHGWNWTVGPAAMVGS